jgi:hypothetical protein
MIDIAFYNLSGCSKGRKIRKIGIFLLNVKVSYSGNNVETL